MTEKFNLQEIKIEPSCSPFELNEIFSSDLISDKTKNKSVADSASNGSSPIVANNKIKRKEPIEKNDNPIDFTPLKYDVSNLMYNEVEINVNYVVKKVKEILVDNEINQNCFGKALLNCAESTISILLTKAKDWKMLSRRGREPYYKMYLWLKDPNGLDKLTSWVQEYKRAIKLSKKKQRQTDDDDDDEEWDKLREFVSSSQSPISTISNNSTNSNDNLIRLNEPHEKSILDTSALQHQHLVTPQPMPCTTSSSLLSGAVSFRPPIQFNNPDHAQLHKIALDQSIQHVPAHQIHQQPIPTLHHSIQPTQSNPTVLTQSTPIYITSRPYAYNGMGMVTNNNHLYGISQEQSLKLENYHKVNPYPTNDALIHLSQVFNININSLIHWFKSRNAVMVNMPASYNSFCNCHACLSGSSFTSHFH